MQQHHRERAVEQQQHLPGEFLRRIDASFGECLAQPALELLLVRGADLDRRMAGQIGELGRGAQEAAALPFRMPRGPRKIAEDAFDLGGQRPRRLLEPLPE